MTIAVGRGRSRAGTLARESDRTFSVSSLTKTTRTGKPVASTARDLVFRCELPSKPCETDFQRLKSAPDRAMPATKSSPRHAAAVAAGPRRCRGDPPTLILDGPLACSNCSPPFMSADLDACRAPKERIYDLTLRSAWGPLRRIRGLRVDRGTRASLIWAPPTAMKDLGRAPQSH